MILRRTKDRVADDGRQERIPVIPIECETTGDDEDDDDSETFDPEVVSSSLSIVHHEDSPTVEGLMKFMLLGTLAIHTAAAVLLGRYTRHNVPRDELYDVRHFLLVSEVVKFVISACLEYALHSDKISLRELRRPCIPSYMYAAIPSVLYVAQNNLQYVALDHLSAPIYSAISQGKLLMTAIASVALLENRRYSLRQWMCLIVLSVGVSILVVDEKHHTTESASLLIGLTAVLIACICSALAGVTMEILLKKECCSVWARNMHLSLFAILAGIAQVHGSKDQWNNFGQYFNAGVWCLVGMHAGGGLLVAVVVKHADMVLKGLSMGVSVVIVTIVSAFTGNTVSPYFSLGALLVILAVYFFSNVRPTSQNEEILLPRR
jgi:solute carrier family 35 (UDP-sugar transporter), member A1/2/3